MNVCECVCLDNFFFALHYNLWGNETHLGSYSSECPSNANLKVTTVSGFIMIKCFPFKVCLGFDMLFDLTQAHPGLKTYLFPVGSLQSSNIHLRVS